MHAGSLPALLRMHELQACGLVVSLPQGDVAFTCWRGIGTQATAPLDHTRSARRRGPEAGRRGTAYGNIHGVADFYGADVYGRPLILTPRLSHRTLNHGAAVTRPATYRQVPSLTSVAARRLGEER
jgi:hypothetical protein